MLLHILVQKKSMFINCCEFPSLMSFNPYLLIWSLKISKFCSSQLLAEFSNRSKKIMMISKRLMSLSYSHSLTNPKNSAMSDCLPELFLPTIISERDNFNFEAKSALNLCSLDCSLSFGKDCFNYTSFLTASWQILLSSFPEFSIVAAEVLKSMSPAGNWMSYGNGQKFFLIAFLLNMGPSSH